MTWLDVILLLLTAFLAATSLLNRLIPSAARDGPASSSSPPTILYKLLGLVPSVGAKLQYRFDREAFLDSVRTSSPNLETVFTVDGTKHHVINSSTLRNAVLTKRPHTFAIGSPTPSILTTVFHFPQKSLSQYLPLESQLSQTTLNHLNGTPQHKTSLTAKIIRQLEINLPNLTTFMRSPIDQTAWENASETTLSPARSAAGSSVETNLLALVHAFLAHCALPTLLHPAELAPEETTSLCADLRELALGSGLLALGIPDLIAMLYSPLNRALGARSRALGVLERAQSEWAEFAGDHASTAPEAVPADDLALARYQLLRAASLPPAAISSLDLSLLSDLTAQMGFSAFWLLLHLLTQKPAFGDLQRERLLERVQKETGPLVRVVQPDADGIGAGGIREAARVSVDVEGIERECEISKACWEETMRLYGVRWWSWRVREDCEVAEVDTREEGKDTRSYVFQKGDVIEIPVWMHAAEIGTLHDAKAWNPDQHLSQTGDSKDLHAAAWDARDIDSQGTRLVEKIVMSFIAGVLALWDIEIVDSDIPHGSVSGNNFRIPISDVRARISRRENT